MDTKKNKSAIQIYCKCVHCELYFPTNKRRLYCGRSCKNRAQYLKTKSETSH